MAFARGMAALRGEHRQRLAGCIREYKRTCSRQRPADAPDARQRCRGTLLEPGQIKQSYLPALGSRRPLRDLPCGIDRSLAWPTRPQPLRGSPRAVTSPASIHDAERLRVHGVPPGPGARHEAAGRPRMRVPHGRRPMLRGPVRLHELRTNATPRTAPTKCHGVRMGAVSAQAEMHTMV